MEESIWFIADDYYWSWLKDWSRSRICFGSFASYPSYQIFWPPSLNSERTAVKDRAKSLAQR